jgi:hypothetical protein
VNGCRECLHSLHLKPSPQVQVRPLLLGFILLFFGALGGQSLLILNQGLGSRQCETPRDSPIIWTSKVPVLSRLQFSGVHRGLESLLAGL